MGAQETRSRDLIRAAASLGLSLILFAIHRTVLPDAVLLQLWPIALAPIYGIHKRFLLEACWAVAVVLIVAAIWPSATLAEWRALIPAAVAIALVSLTALGIKALSAREHRLRLQAYIDPLTGVLNRRSFLELSGKEEARGRRRDYELAVLMVDIDHFKRVNDTYGHDCGDEVLKGFADRLRGIIRGGDLLCRLGGEEFVIVMPGVDVHAAARIAERALLAIQQEPFVMTSGGEKIVITTSIGLAERRDDTDPHQLYRRADQALYRSKSEGRNRVTADAA